MRAWLLALAVVLAGALSLLRAPAHADEFRPAYLQLHQIDPETYEVTWKVPAREGGLRMALEVRWPEGTVNLVEPHGTSDSVVHVRRWRVWHPGGMQGKVVGVDGLAASSVEVLVRVEGIDGSAQVTRLFASRPSFTLARDAGAFAVARVYSLLGVQHILLGADHLLFVFALVVLVRGGRRIVTTVTAFTLAHSLTLVAATLGWLALPPPPVEAVIALSVAYLAREIVLGWRGQGSLTQRRPWLVAFVFGLLHGLGFAGALAGIGLPEKAVPLALACFNIGVEIGQLLFVAAVLGAAAAGRRWVARPLPALQWIAPYAIGGTASFWLIDRVLAFTR